MVKVKNGLARHRRHKKFIKAAKGFSLGRKNVYKQVRLALVKQGQHAYVGRKEKKRDQKQLWIERLSGTLRNKGSKYSVFINIMKKNNIILNKKVLSNISIVFPQVFDKMYLDITTKTFEKTSIQENVMFVQEGNKENTNDIVKETEGNEKDSIQEKKVVKNTTKKTTKKITKNTK